MKQIVKEKREKLTIFTGAFFGILCVYSILMILLMTWAISTSFKSEIDFKYNKYGIPQEWTNNFANAFELMIVPTTMKVNGVMQQVGVKMGLQIINSLLYSIGGAIIMTIVPCFVAYLTANFPYKFSSFITNFVIVVMIIPIVGSQAAELSLLRKLNLFDSIIGNYIQKFHFLGMYYLVFHTSFKGVPKEYSEAASLDGAGEFYIMTRIIMPFVKTMIYTVFLIKFIELWNDYQTPLLYLPSYPTVSYGVYYVSVLNPQNGIGTTVRVASSILIALPLIGLFVAFKDKIIGSLSMGGIKE